ncbi:MAG: ribose-phosphate diphosphokinase [Saccharofermentanales bacterium]
MSVPTVTDDKNYYIYNQYGDNTMEPVGPIGIIAHNLASSFADSINYFLRNRRSIYLARHPELANNPGFMRADYRIPVTTPRYSSGEGKAIITQTVRGHDLFIIVDVLNYNRYYERYSQRVSLSPDEQYQDLLRIILAASGKARRINLIMPYLYEGRQYRRGTRESLDCAAMLKELFALGIKSILTFDAHDPRIINAVPTENVENLTAAYQIIESMIQTVPDLKFDYDHFMVVSPDEEGITRAMYYASMLEVPLGIFYRKRNYLQLVEGRNPIVGLEFLGSQVKGKDILLVDDMIVSGSSILRAANELKKRGAGRIFCAATFTQLTSGLDRINQAHMDGVIEKIFSTNLIYCRPEILNAPWFVEVSLSRFIALLIDAINHDASLSKLISPTEKIQKLLNYHRRRQT